MDIRNPLCGRRDGLMEIDWTNDESYLLLNPRMPPEEEA